MAFFYFILQCLYFYFIERQKKMKNPDCMNKTWPVPFVPVGDSVQNA